MQETIKHHAAEAHGFNPWPPHAHPRQRGIAMLLVLIAVAIATVLSMSFLASQATTHGVAQNVQKHAQARSVAESALVAAIQYVQTDSNFRSDKANGQWVTNASFNGGTFDLFGYDGLDTDGDGVVDDTDSDLADDTSDPVTITAIGYFDGVSHTVHAVVTPGSGSSAGNLLFVVVDDASLAAGDVKRKAFFESLGWTVTPIDDDSTQGEFDAAVADADVVYISETVNSYDVGTAFTTKGIGVVDEERLLHDEFEFASSGASTHTAQTIDITDNTHYITSPFATGSLQVASTGIVFIRNNSTVGPGAQVLATNGTPTLFVFDTGDELEDGSSAAGRRVALFIGDTDMDFDNLTDDGKTIVERSLVWASSGSAGGGVYDYATRTQGTDIWAYAGEVSSNPMWNNTSPSSELNSGEYDALEADDSSEFSVNTSSNSNYSTMRYVIQIDEDEVDVARLDVTWIGRNYNEHGPRQDGVDLFIWNYATGSYELLSTSADTEAEVTLNGAVSADLADYIGGGSSNTITLLAQSADMQTGNRDNILYCDYVVLAVTTGVAGAGPQLVALYEFYEGTPTPPAMVGHWPLDDTGGGGAALTAGVSMQNRLYMYSSSTIDSYSSSAGAYGPGNSGSDAYLTIDATMNARIQMTGSSSIKGNVDVGPGGDPSTVIQSYSSVGITGSTGTLGSAVGFPSLSAPSGMPSTLGNTTYNGGAILINSDRTFTDLTLNGGAVITISGNVRIDVKDDLTLNSGSRIVLAPGASLELFVADKVDLNSGSTINPDTSRPSSLSLYMYGISSDMALNNSSYISGIVYVADVLTLSSSSAIYGAVWADNQITMNVAGAIHIDTDLIGGMVVADNTGGNNGSQNGDVTAGVAGHGDGGTAIDFDGVDDYIEVAHNDAYLLDNGSLSFWFNSDSLTGHRGLVSKDSLNFDTGGHLHVYTDGSVLKARLQSTSASYEVQSTGLSTGTWYHVVVSWGSGGLKLFRNGVERDTDSYTGGLGTTSGGVGNYEPMVFGATTWNSGDLTASPVENYFDGRIDDVRIYDQGLDESQADELYNGEEPSGGVGNVVYDTGGYGVPLDLDIENIGAISWVPGGGLTLNSATRVSSAAAATKLYDALTATNQFSVEVKFTPANTSQSGPARIVSYSGGASDTNFTFGQDADAYVARLDTTSTTSAGTPEADSGSMISAGVEQHVILSYDGSNITMYNSDGTSTTLARTGNLDWDNTFGLLMGNETIDGYGWLGTLSRVAIYDQVFNQTQADNVFNGLPPGNGSSGAGGVDWIEP